jgi:glycogen(starch) synthase
MSHQAPKIRVCMLVTNEAKYDSRVLREAKSLSQCGFQVLILALDRKGDNPLWEENNGFRIMRCREWRVGSWLRSRRLVTIRGCGKALMALRFLLFVLKVQAEIFHAHDLSTLPFAYLSARRKGAKIVYDSHEIFTEQWPSSRITSLFRILLLLLRPLEFLLIRRVDATITVGPLIARELASRYSIPPPLVIRNCATLAPRAAAQFSIRDSLAIPSSDRILLHIGALVPIGRALSELVLALKLASSSLHLVFLGEGPMEDELKGLIEAQGLGDRVHFHRPIPPQHLIPAMKEAELAAILMKEDGCLNNRYSLPNKLFEAIAAGLPVVASDLPEMAHLVRSYDIGVLCRPEDPADIARAIEEALEPSRYALFKANLRRAQEDLNWEKESQKLIELYRNLLPGPA